MYSLFALNFKMCDKGKKWTQCINNTRMECITRQHWYSRRGIYLYVWGCDKGSPITHSSLCHLPVRTEAVGRLGLLLVMAQLTIIFIFFAFELCPFYIRLLEIGKPFSSQAILKLVEEFHLDSAGMKKKAHPVPSMLLLLFTSIWVPWKRESGVWIILSSGDVVFPISSIVAKNKMSKPFTSLSPQI